MRRCWSQRVRGSEGGRGRGPLLHREARHVVAEQCSCRTDAALSPCRILSSLLSSPLPPLVCCCYAMFPQ